MLISDAYPDWEARVIEDFLKADLRVMYSRDEHRGHSGCNPRNPLIRDPDT